MKLCRLYNLEKIVEDGQGLTLSDIHQLCFSTLSWATAAQHRLDTMQQKKTHDSSHGLI